MALFVWAFFTIISLFILYLIIKTAINHSEISRTGSELQTLQTQLNRQHQEMIKQIEQLSHTIISEK